MIISMDDILLMAENKKLLKDQAAAMVEMIQSLGFIINKDKCILEPQQEMEFLGFIVNTQNMTLLLPRDKIEKIQKECRLYKNKQQMTVQELEHLIGLLSSTNHAIVQAPMRYRALQRLKNQALTLGKAWHSIVRLDQPSVQDLNFWIREVQYQNWKPIFLPAAKMVIYSDASTQGWGARCRDTRTGGPWTMEERRHHINYLEMMAAFLALQTFAPHVRQHVQLMIDNTTTIAYINHKGGTHSKELSDLAIKCGNGAYKGISQFMQNTFQVSTISKQTGNPERDWTAQIGSYYEQCSQR